MVSVITHKKFSTVANSANNSLVQPSDWNDDHNINIPALVAEITPVTPVLSGPFTAAAAAGVNIFTVYNTSGGIFTFNLPLTPATNQIVEIIDAALTSALHQININGNGNDISAYGILGSDPVGIASNGGSISLAWDGIQWTQNG